ncbi:MAG: AraC family transcriptional regulator [Myxococcales bacterium]|nr:AraC family transcriptional regulator [Myxococcales bacterium]
MAPTSRLARLIGEMVPKDGGLDTHYPGLHVFRTSKTTGPFAVEYHPSLCVVAQGAKEVSIGGTVVEYNADKYLVASLSVPVEARIVEASSTRPLLALVLTLDLGEVAQLMLTLPSRRRDEVAFEGQLALKTSIMDERLKDALARLLEASTNELESRVLGPGFAREVMFRILSGEQGQNLRRLALQGSGSQRVARAVQYLRDNYTEQLDVATIAKAIGVSESTLQHSFKKATSLSPIQYLKKLRLHQARVLMVANGLNAGEAAHRVGYGSPSQFSREFKRMFGQTPSDTRRPT